MKIFPLLILLTGCASYSPVIYQPTQIKIVYADKLMINNGKPIAGYALWGEDRCIVVLPRNDLSCIAHEIAHCFKGPFHGQMLSREYCD